VEEKQEGEKGKRVKRWGRLITTKIKNRRGPRDQEEDVEPGKQEEQVVQEMGKEVGEEEGVGERGWGWARGGGVIEISTEL
jgi:hypothetical protein